MYRRLRGERRASLSLTQSKHLFVFGTAPMRSLLEHTPGAQCTYLATTPDPSPTAEGGEKGSAVGATGCQPGVTCVVWTPSQRYKKHEQEKTKSNLDVRNLHDQGSALPRLSITCDDFSARLRVSLSPSPSSSCHHQRSLTECAALSRAGMTLRR